MSEEKQPVFTHLKEGFNPPEEVRAATLELTRALIATVKPYSGDRTVAINALSSATISYLRTYFPDDQEFVQAVAKYTTFLEETALAATR